MEPKPHACTLEITVISGENICVDRSPVAENVYVVVRAESLNCCTTKMVEENGGILAWNEKFTLDIPMHARSITFEVQCKKYKGVRPIGVARIGLSDFLVATNTSDESGPQMLSYGLRDWDGRRNGVLHLSARVAAPVAPPEDKLCSETKPVKEETFVSFSGFEQEVMENSSMEKHNSNDGAICILVWLRAIATMELKVNAVHRVGYNIQYKTIMWMIVGNGPLSHNRFGQPGTSPRRTTVLVLPPTLSSQSPCYPYRRAL